MIAPLLRAAACWRGARSLLAACLALALALAACSPEEAPAETACSNGTYPAVELELVDEAGVPLNGASLRYRLDDGPWQTWPERAGQRTVIRGRPGSYQIEVAKQGHQTGETTLAVPAETGEACQPSLQTVTLQLARLACPDPPAALLLAVDPPLPGLELSAALPDSGRQTPACLEAAGESCPAFSLPVAELGQYDLTLSGLPGLGPMQVFSNVVAYDPPPVEVSLEHRGQREVVEVTGADAAALAFPVRRDEANCPLADFRALETTLEPGPSAGERRPPLAVYYQGSLTITDLGAAACRTEPIPTSLPFAVDLPAGADLAGVQVLVEYGDGWQPATCAFAEGVYTCQALVPNPLRNRPFAVRALAAGEEAIGMQLPFSGMCLIFE